MAQDLPGAPDRSGAMSKDQARGNIEPITLTGVEKVTVLLLALSRPKAAQLLKRMDADEIRLIARAANRLPVLSADHLAQLVDEFAHLFSGGINFVGSAKEVQGLLAEVMTEEEAADLLADGPGRDEPVWAKVARLKDDIIRAYLLREHPQTVALILSRLAPQLAARLIGSLPAELRNTLLIRMLGIKTVAPDALEVLEATLREDLITLQSPAGGAHTGVAEILNRLDKVQFDAVLKHLSMARPADVGAMRSMLFTFDDLASLPPKALALVLNQVSTERVVLALREADFGFQEAVLTGLPARARRMVELELQAESDASAREIADARRTIVDVVLKLMAQRQIEPPAADIRAAS